MKNITTKVSLLALLAFVPMAAQAETETVTASIVFDTPLTIDGTATINFGTVAAADAGAYTVATDGTLSTVGGNILSDTGAAAAALAVHGSTFTTINITANNYSAAAGGVTVSAATCNYGGAGEAACNSITAGAAPGASTPLLVGATLTADATPTASNTPVTATFDIVVLYN